MSNVLARAIEAHNRGDRAAAVRLYEQTLGVTSHNLAVLADEAGQHEHAQNLYRQALRCDPGRAESAYALSLNLLREGRYQEAWPLHERRREIPRLAVSDPGIPEWKGEPLAGRRLVVVGDQGLGDQIMFARFLEPLRAAGAEVLFSCFAPLVRLTGGQHPLRVARSEVDFWVPLMSLPLRLGVTVDTIPPPLAIPVEHCGGGGVGVMPAGNPGYAKDSSRTPPAEIQAQLLGLGRDLRPEATGATDMLDTAQIIAGLDLVVSVDTSVAHLAGSLGVPTWVLLPAHNADWRWLRGREDSLWYPSVRLLRQPAPGDWAGLLEQVRGQL